MLSFTQPAPKSFIHLVVCTCTCYTSGAIQDSAARDAVCDGLGILPSAEAFEQALCFPNGAPPTPPSEAGEGEYGGDGGAAPGLASALASDARDKLAKAVYSKLFKAVKRDEN